MENQQRLKWQQVILRLCFFPIFVFFGYIFMTVSNLVWLFTGFMDNKISDLIADFIQDLDDIVKGVNNEKTAKG